MNTEKIGKFIALKRKEKNMTQRELADKLGVTDRAVSKWERGMGCPDVSLLDELSKELEISIVELLNGEEMVNPTIIEKDLIKSMSYSKEYTKTKIKNIANTILLTIIIGISILLVMLNIINYYLLNKNYDMAFLSNELNDTIGNVEKYCDVILSNQGIYSYEDYTKLTNYVQKVKKRLNKETRKYLFKEKYTMRDYYDFEKYYEENLKDIYFDNKSNYYIYFILLKYDTNIVDNMLTYQSRKEFIDRISFDLSQMINNSYKYKTNFKLSGIYSPVSIINAIYDKEEILLKDIIKVGELNEEV